MDNPEKLATLSTQNTGRRQATKQQQNQTNKHKQKQKQNKANKPPKNSTLHRKLKNMSHADRTKNPGVIPDKVSRVIHIVKTGSSRW